MTKRTHSNEYAGTPIAGITGTFYPDLSDPRFEISLDNAERWRDNSLPLVVVDGSPEGAARSVRNALKQRGATVLRSIQNGIATQRQQGAAHVLQRGGNKFVTHEPEKPDTADFALPIADLLDDNSIVVVGRTEESLATMPPVQRRTEDLAGWILQQTHGLPADALAGPRGYNRDGARYLADYPSDKPGMNNWIYMYENPIRAMDDGRLVTGVKIGLNYPSSMAAQETGDPVFDRKRYDQFRLQLEYLLGETHLVKPEAQGIADIVLRGFASLPENPTNEDYEQYFTDLGLSLSSSFGYDKVQ